ncbi:MAG: TIR domain-containing protein [candidate division SR1 bacterium]|nr:TIR domain-containing protein [candidate division SR1 bacterium]
MRDYNVFISHSWSYGKNYEQLSKMLVNSPYFSHKDYSVPKNDPIHNAPNQKLLEEAIERQIKPCSVVLILAGVYATYSKWINIEIEIAKRLNKPIIAIQPWASERTSKIVKDSATKIVGRNSPTIVQAIKDVVLYVQ